MEQGNIVKKRRHMKILELISSQDIETQDDLSELLRIAGFEVTQATVSRDIRELKLTKSADENGIYKYTISQSEDDKSIGKYGFILRETVVSCEKAHSLVVVKTISGMANAACAAIDHMQWPHVVGTIAGDDTIFIVVKEPEDVKNVVEALNSILSRA